MSDIRPKLTLRAGINGSELSSPPSTKLMLNHGKPNFTINRLKSKTDTQCPFSPPNTEAATVVLKSASKNTNNGYIKPSAIKIPLSAENEVSKVVLRRTKLPEENSKTLFQDEEPEFVKAQRKIAERLATQNNLDFESRKSGYFTHVMISPTSPTKQMDLPVVEDHKIERANVVEIVSETLELEKKPQNPCDEKTTINTESHRANGHFNGECNPLSESSEEEKTVEVVEVAKALIEELVQNVANKITETTEEVSNSVQNGMQNGYENDAHNIVQSEVNFEPKTITSFAKELSSEPNNYPDTVKTIKEVSTNEQDEFMQDMYKLKFDIHADDEDVKVIPTVKATD